MRKVLLIILAVFGVLIALAPETELTPEQQVKENRFNIALASKMDATKLVKLHLKDPSSLKDLQIGISLEDSMGVATGRSRNGFGGYSFFRAEFKIDYNDSIGNYRVYNFKIK